MRILVTRVCVFASLVVLATASGENTRRILRRRKDKPVKYTPEQCAYQKPELYFTIVGEYSDPEARFVVPDPTLSTFRDNLGWGDDEVAKFWADASDFFFESYGVDLRDVPVDPATGMKMSDDWGIGVVSVRGLHVPYTSVHGVFDCPVEVHDIALMLAPTRDGLSYHGKWGGEEGFAAAPTDFLMFGAYIIDFDGQEDSEPTVWFYNTDGGPGRMDYNMAMQINCAVRSERWGEGNNDGRIMILPGGDTTPDGIPHFSMRALFSFPGRVFAPLSAHDDY